MNTLSRGTVPSLVLVVASGGFRRFKLQTARWGQIQSGMTSRVWVSSKALVCELELWLMKLQS